MAQVEASGPAVPSGPCNKTTFATHVGLAQGAVNRYLWKPLQGGAFADNAANRVKTLRNGADAGRLAARELAAASPLITGCPLSIPLVNALTTGTSLAKAAGTQLAAGTPNLETLAGVNSILSTVVAQASKIGIKVTETAPTPAQLAVKG